MITRQNLSGRDLRIRIVSKPTNTEHISDTVLSDDPDLFFTVEAGKRYYLTACVYAIVGAGGEDPDIRYAITTPTETRTSYQRSQTAFNVGTLLNGTITSSLLPTAEETVFLQAVLLPTASGTVHLQFAQSGSFATPTIVLAGSCVVVYETS